MPGCEVNMFYPQWMFITVVRLATPTPLLEVCGIATLQEGAPTGHGVITSLLMLSFLSSQALYSTVTMLSSYANGRYYSSNVAMISMTQNGP